MRVRTLPLLISWLSLIGVAYAAPDRGTQEALHFEKAFGEAVENNDVALLEKYLAADWRIISSDGTIIARSTFLQVIGSGALKHQGMSSSDEEARRFGSVVLITARARSAGSYQGVAFSTDEMSTDVIAKRHGHWQCVLTQLTSIAKK